jgi:TolA-binding protein
LLGGLTTTAQAEPSDSKNESAFMQHYRQAMRLAKEEDWTGAIAAFQRAYDARETPRPEIHLYIARAHLNLSHGSEALAAYRRFLRESKTPKPAQLSEVNRGMSRAQELIELQTQRERLQAQESALAARAADARPENPRSAKASGAEDNAEGPPSPRAATQPGKDPAEPAAAGHKVTVRARNPKNIYTLGVGADSVCTSPCQLKVPAGPTTVTVTGPGTKQFQRNVLFPNGPSQIHVQHFTLSRAIAGSVLLALSVPFWVEGVLLLVKSDLIFAGVLTLHGAVFSGVGIGQLASIKRNSVEIQPLSGSLALGSSSLRLANLDLSPTPDRKGAVASATLRF